MALYRHGLFLFIFVKKHQKSIEMEKFYKFTETAVIDTFGIVTIRNCDELNNWLSNQGETVSNFENETLDMALKRFEELSQAWNEEELKMHFISPILSVANPNILGVCKTYFERPLEGIVQNRLMNIKTDCMVAQPKLGGDPNKPYFFLQEFKQKQLWGKTDPQGQMLVAMLLAQEFNADGKYLYGCFVKENNWRFTTLKGLNYCVSRQYDATQKTDLLQIVFILRKLKELITSRNS